jgi:hypothetical protein
MAMVSLMRGLDGALAAGRFAQHVNADFGTDDRAHGASGTGISAFVEVGRMIASAVEYMRVDGEDVAGADDGAELAAFAPFLIDKYGTYRHQLPHSNKIYFHLISA